MAKNVLFFQKNLLEWFQLNKRDFPWRNKDVTPYEILLVEIMMRRTTAKVVKRVFPVFLKQYPTFDSLINADDESIIEIIKPLGKYNLKCKIFKDVANLYLSSKESISDIDFGSVNGIGEYTFNTYQCFAFNKRIAIIDSNVSRIYSRYFGFKLKTTEESINAFSQRILPVHNFREFNMALIDFGGLVCKPNKPLCFKCNLRTKCFYYQSLL